jgi:hypothetical protein
MALGTGGRCDVAGNPRLSAACRAAALVNRREPENPMKSCLTSLKATFNVVIFKIKFDIRKVNS